MERRRIRQASARRALFLILEVKIELGEVGREVEDDVGRLGNDNLSVLEDRRSKGRRILVCSPRQLPTLRPHMSSRTNRIPRTRP